MGYAIWALLTATLPLAYQSGPLRWEAKWIWHPGETAGTNLVWLARKSFEVARTPRSARIFITADSHYRLYVNGRFVHRGPARCIPERQSFDSLDVTSLLTVGKNVLAVLVHHYGVHTVRYNLGKPGLLVQLEIDGQTIRSDRSWRGRKGDAWVSDTTRVHEWGKGMGQGFTEILDFRKYPSGWEEVGYDDSHWQQAEELRWPADWPVNDPPPEARAVMRPWVSLVPRNIPSLSESLIESTKVISRMEAIEYRKLYGVQDVALNLAQDVLVPLQHCRIAGEGPLTIVNGPRDPRLIETDGIRSAHVVFDLGEARNGYARLEISGPRGTIVDVSYAPYLVGGRVVPTLMSIRNADRIILSGRTDRWEALDWRNFRYLALTVRGTDGAVRVFSAGMTRIDYPFRRDGSLEVEDEPELTRLWQAAARTLEVITTDAYQDNYREQFQYAGTSYYAARANYAAFGDTKLQRQYLTQVPLSMMADGMMLPAYPGGEQGRRVILEYNLLWVMGLADYVEYSGDRQTATELTPALERILGRFAEMENEQGLLDSPPYAYWIDWANIDRRGVSFPLNVFYLLALESAARLGVRDAATYRLRAANIRRALRDGFWDSKRGLFADAKVDGTFTGRFSEHSNGMALAADIATADQARQIVHELLRPGTADIEPVSPLFMYWLVEGLFRTGFGREALDLMKQRYANMLAADHGTLWEEWSLLASRGSGRWRPSSRALAQAENTFAAYTLSRWLLGVDPISARGTNLLIRYPNPGLRRVRGSLPGATGRIEIAWSNSARESTLEVTLPNGVSAEVALDSFGIAVGEVTLDGKVWRSISRPKFGPGRHILIARAR